MPTTVWVSWTWNRLGEIDPVDGTFSLDGYLNMAWVDNRLDSNATISVQGSSTSASTSWVVDGDLNEPFFVPWPEFVNEEFQLLNNPPIWQAWIGAPSYSATPSVLALYNVTAAVSNNNLTWVQLYGRCAATYYGTANLVDFPFDRQDIPFSIESVAWADSLLVYRGAPGFDALLTPNLYVPGFDILYCYSMISSTYYPAWQQNYSRWSAVAYVSRNASYYLKKSILNVIMLVFMALMATLLRPNDTSRATIQLTLFLGIVSWVFVLSNDSPRSQVSTRMDEFITVSFVVLFLLFLYHSTTMVFYHRIAKVKQTAAAAKAQLAAQAQAQQPMRSRLLGALRRFGGGSDGAAGVLTSRAPPPLPAAPLRAVGSAGGADGSLSAAGGADVTAWFSSSSFAGDGGYAGAAEGKSLDRGPYDGPEPVRPRRTLSGTVGTATRQQRSDSRGTVLTLDVNGASTGRGGLAAVAGAENPLRMRKSFHVAAAAAARRGVGAGTSAGPAAASPGAAAAADADATVDDAAPDTICGMRCHIRLRDLMFTSIILCAYVIAVAIVLSPPPPRPAPPPLV